MNSTAKVAQDSANKLHLTIDGNPIANWFAQKYTQYKEQQQTMQSPPKRGIRM